MPLGRACEYFAVNELRKNEVFRRCPIGFGTPRPKCHQASEIPKLIGLAQKHVNDFKCITNFAMSRQGLAVAGDTRKRMIIAMEEDAPFVMPQPPEHFFVGSGGNWPVCMN